MIYLIVGALVVGLVLGLLGSGGSILTLPVLVYLLGHDDKAAIAESLAIVGGIACFSLLPYARSRQVDWRSVAYFGIPGMVGTYGGAWLARFVVGSVQLTAFAVVLLVAAALMFRRARADKDSSTDRTTSPTDLHRPATGSQRHANWKIALEGIAVGVVTGFVGVGGGFLIVPALVLLGGLTMRIAVGTSLAVIFLNCLSGLYKYSEILAAGDATIQWSTVIAFIVVGAVGSLSGRLLGGHLNQRALQTGFAVFLLAMGLFVFRMEAPKVLFSKPQPAPASARPEKNLSSQFTALAKMAPTAVDCRAKRDAPRGTGRPF